MKSAVALLLGLCVAALVWAQNTTLSRTVTDGQVREQVITHKGQDPDKDADGDGLSNSQELALGTNPNNPDSDGDGMDDGLENALGTNPTQHNSNPVTEITWLTRMHDSGSAGMPGGISPWQNRPPFSFIGHDGVGPISAWSEFRILVPPGRTGVVHWIENTTAFFPVEPYHLKVEKIRGWVIDGPISPVFTLEPPSLPSSDGSGSVSARLLTGDLRVDANRDGQISSDGSDATSAAQPFRFWINDDDDSGDTEGNDVPLSAGGSISRNCDDFRVNGNRDLIDWFPVFLDIKTLLDSFPPESIVGSGSGVRYKLRHSEGAVKVVFTALTRAEALKFQTQDMGAKFSEGNPVQLASPLQEAWTYHITSSGFDIFAKVPDFYGTVINNNGGVILVEGITETTAPLILTVEKPDGTLLAESKLDLKIVPMENMFHYLNLRHLAPGGSIDVDKRGPQWNTIELSPAPDDPMRGIPNRKNLVMLHGYNWNGNQARGWSAEMFKRLYWSGNTARVISVLWRGDDSQIPILNKAPDFHVNVGHAFQQAPLLRGFLNSLAPTPTAVLGHSLGNLVASFALTYERDPNNFERVRAVPRPAHVFEYFLINAAVPLEAYDSADQTSESLDLMRHPVWVGYDERLRAVNWNELFSNTSDARNDLTWKSLLAGLDIGVNFYSTGEEILVNPIDRSVPIMEPLINAGQFGWVSQEKHKGLTFDDSPSAVAFRSHHGGWGFDPEWYISVLTPEGMKRVRLPHGEALEENVPTSELPKRPFFRWFQDSETNGYYPNYNGSRLRASIGDAGADDEARKLVTRAKLLAEAIPALSYATGRNPSGLFNRLGKNEDLNNENSSNFVYRTGWPAGRDTRDWRHGDFREVAYRFVNPLYHRIVELGGLRP